MSGEGSPNLTVKAEGFRVAIVAASWHAEIMGGLIEGAQRAADEAGAQWDLFEVPGSFELPVVSDACARSGGYHAVVALGVVIRGGTPHFEYVCSATSDALARVALDHRIPVGFGLLTCDTEQQARDRAGLPGSQESKGKEAMDAALATAQVLRTIA